MTNRQPAESPHREAAPGADFRTTHWSLVLEAGRASQPGSRAALEELCRRYWYPLYAFARKRGRSHADAQDLVQGFFAHLLARNDLATVHPDKGRFRTFLLTALSHFITNEWHRSQAQKRGGGLTFETLDFADPDLDRRYQATSAGTDSAETLFDRSWAEELLEAVLARLQAEHADGVARERFETLRSSLLGESAGVPYAELAQRLSLTEAGVKSAVHRLRGRFRELFREEIGRTVARREEIDAELRYLVEVMTR